MSNASNIIDLRPRVTPSVQQQVLDVPPHSPQVEQAFLGTLLAHPTLQAQFRESVPIELFYDLRHQVVWAAMRQHHPLDLPLLCDALPEATMAQAGGVLYLAEILQAASTASQAAVYMQRLRADHQARTHMVLAQRMLTDAYVIPPNDFHAKYSPVWRSLTPAADDGAAAALTTVLADVDRAYQAAAANPLPYSGLDTGFRDLNAQLDGLCPAELTVLAGRPGMGKTTLALQIMTAVATQGVGVGFFSLEMSPSQIGQRLLSIETALPVFGIRRGSLSAAEYRAMQQTTARLSQLPLYIDAQSGATLGQIEAAMDAIERQAAQPIGLWVIDYLQLMRGEGYNENEELNNITRGLKAITRDRQVPLLLLSQLNREVERRPEHRPQLSDLRGSGGVEQDADNVLLAYRPGYYQDIVQRTDAAERAALQAVAELIVGKSRYGDARTLDLRWYESGAYFGDAETTSLTFEAPPAQELPRRIPNPYDDESYEEVYT